MLGLAVTKTLSSKQVGDLKAKVNVDPELTGGVLVEKGREINIEEQFGMKGQRKYRDFNSFSDLLVWAGAYRSIRFPGTNRAKERIAFKRGIKMQVIDLLYKQGMQLDSDVQSNVCWSKYYSASDKTITKFLFQDRLQAWKDCKVYKSICGKGIVLDFGTCQMSFEKPKGLRVWDLKPSTEQWVYVNEHVISKFFNPILAGDAQEHYEDGLTAGVLELGIARDILDEKGAREMNLLLNLALGEGVSLFRVSECDIDKMARNVSMLEELMDYAEVCGLESISTIEDVCSEMMRRLYAEDNGISDVVKIPTRPDFEMDVVGQLAGVNGSSLSKKTKTLLSGIILMRATETEADTFGTWTAKGHALNQMEGSLGEYIQD